jgi:DNA polymerase-3 subunit alpha
MDVFRNWITLNKEDILTNLNTQIFKEDWDKYASGNISAWEMETMCFYYHDHELAELNSGKYGIVDFFKLPENPVVEKTFVRGGKEVNIFKLSKICGTCIAKNKTKSTVTLLTTSGVVNVKFRKEYFAMFDKQISVRGDDGVKHVAEKSWFNRGKMIVVQGIRSGDDFISKKYASSGGHQLYLIDSIDEAGDITLRTQRYQGEAEDEE